MGGNALSFETRRVSKVEYEIILQQLENKVLQTENAVFLPIQAYTNKKDFGDIDVLLYVESVHDRVRWIRDMFNPKEIYSNSNVHSFDFNGVQVDFIFPKKEDLVSSFWYFSYNDLGNLLGRIYHKMGLRFGHDGLSMLIREDDHVIGEILLSKNIDEILEFGGFSAERFHEGFDDLKDIFEYVVSTPFYDYSIFDLGNRNYRSRVRDRKRKTYTEFLEWASKNKKTPLCEWVKDKKTYLPFIFSRFGHEQEYRDIIEKNDLRKKVKEKFNGEIIMKLTGLQGKELGAFMTKFRNVFQDDVLLQTSAESIKEEVLFMFEKEE